MTQTTSWIAKILVVLMAMLVGSAASNKIFLGPVRDILLDVDRYALEAWKAALLYGLAGGIGVGSGAWMAFNITKCSLSAESLVSILIFMFLLAVALYMSRI